MRCENCRFVHVVWRKGDVYEYQRDFMPYDRVSSTRAFDFAQCRRHAPSKAAVLGDCDGWPSVTLWDWCGEYHPPAALGAMKNGGSDG